MMPDVEAPKTGREVWIPRTVLPTDAGTLGSRTTAGVRQVFTMDNDVKKERSGHCACAELSDDAPLIRCRSDKMAETGC
jgi:hypothetical protein